MLFAKLFSPASFLLPSLLLGAVKTFFCSSQLSSIWDFITFPQLYIYLCTVFVVAWPGWPGGWQTKCILFFVVLRVAEDGIKDAAMAWLGLAWLPFRQFPLPISSTRNAFGTFCWLECLIFMVYCMTLEKGGERRSRRRGSSGGYIVLSLVLV